MEDHLYLPELTVDKKITSPSVSGFWKNDSRMILRGISDAIVIGENMQGVSSIPDIWARPLMFQNFLLSVYKKLDPKIPDKDRKSLNSLELRTFQEWKGLLSLLALSQTKLKYDNIEMLSYQLPPVMKDLKEDRFSKALRTLAPSPIKLEKGQEYEWTNTIIIKYRKIAVGAFSPSTLVFSASDYNEEFKKQFAQKAGKSSDLLDVEGYLCPPKNDNDLLAIGEWLTKLTRMLGGDDKVEPQIDPLLNLRDENNETDKIIATTIKVLLEIWLKEIKTKLGKEDEEIDSKRVKISDKILGFKENNVPTFLKNYKIYEVLLKPLIPEDDNEVDKSDILLDFKRNKCRYKEKIINQIVLISDQLYAEDYRLWGIQYSALGDKITEIIEKYFSDIEGVGQEIKGKVEASVNLVKDGIIWIRPELYFLTDTLLTAKNDAFILNNGEGEFNSRKTQYILPFRKEILDFFTPENIKDNLNPRFEVDGNKITFHFKLPVKNGDPISVKKSYRKKEPKNGEGTIIETEVPVIELFPDYLENWRRYYLFQSHVDQFSVVPINAELEFTKQQRKYSVEINKVNQKVNIIEISGDKAFPEAIEVSDDKGIPSGLILLNKYLKEKEDDTVENEEKIWHSVEIGIDFGTSNTNVYFLPDNSEGKRWSYKFPKYLRQITLSNADYRKEILNNSFIPTRNHPLPIPTALLNRSGCQDSPSLLLDYFIFFTKSEDDYIIPQNVYTNLKWELDEVDDIQGKRKSNINNTDWFIESLLFLILLEISRKSCREVIINCTFPKAFSDHDRTRFGKYWEMALEKLLLSENRIIDEYIDGKTSDFNKNKPQIIGPYLLTEGIAAGYFFANPDKFSSFKDKKVKPATLADGAICLDVGGGTTDISIWCGGHQKALYDTSVLLAGKEISGFIRNSSDVYNLLFSTNGVDALKEKKDSESSFAAILNLILKSEEKKVYNNLVKNIAQPSFQLLRRTILLEFGAIAYYTGILCKSQFEKPDGAELKAKIEERGINLYWGGNGAKFISWLDYGQFTANSTCVKFLNTIFFYSLKLHGINPHTNILQFSSTEPKSEACGGIIVSEINERNLASSNVKTVNNNQQKDGNIIDLNLDIITATSSTGKSNISNQLELICGEKIELLDGNFIESHEPIKDNSLFEGYKTKVKNTTLGELELFIKLLNQASLSLGLLKQGNEINLDDNKKADLKSHILNELKMMQTREVDKRRIEPIFIQEVKKLMKLI